MSFPEGNLDPEISKHADCYCRIEIVLLDGSKVALKSLTEDLLRRGEFLILPLLHVTGWVIRFQKAPPQDTVPEHSAHLDRVGKLLLAKRKGWCCLILNKSPRLKPAYDKSRLMMLLFIEVDGIATRMAYVEAIMSDIRKAAGLRFTEYRIELENIVLG